MRIGILGTGFGRRHCEIWLSFPDVEVAGIAGRDEKRTQEVTQAPGVAGCTDPDELINDLQVDIIDVCLPTSVHEKYAIAALTQGKHVLCETPVAHTLAEAERMAQTDAISCSKAPAMARTGANSASPTSIRRLIRSTRACTRAAR
jgi:predicted dehydrogenase